MDLLHTVTVQVLIHLNWNITVISRLHCFVFSHADAANMFKKNVISDILWQTWFNCLNIFSHFWCTENRQWLNKQSTHIFLFRMNVCIYYRRFTYKRIFLVIVFHNFSSNKEKEQKIYIFQKVLKTQVKHNANIQEWLWDFLLFPFQTWVCSTV